MPNTKGPMWWKGAMGVLFWKPFARIRKRELSIPKREKPLPAFHGTARVMPSTLKIIKDTTVDAKGNKKGTTECLALLSC